MKHWIAWIEGGGDHGKKKGRTSFLKKRSKKLLLFTTPDKRSPRAVLSGAQAKVFWFFFSKKNCFLTLPSHDIRRVACR
jgi:hypothetical protein